MKVQPISVLPEIQKCVALYRVLELLFPGVVPGKERVMLGVFGKAPVLKEFLSDP